MTPAPDSNGRLAAAPECEAARDRMVEAMENPVAEAEVRAHVRHCTHCARIWRDLHDVAGELTRAASSLSVVGTGSGRVDSMPPTEPGLRVETARRGTTDGPSASASASSSGLAERVMERIRAESRRLQADSTPAAGAAPTVPWKTVAGMGAVIVVLVLVLVAVLASRPNPTAPPESDDDDVAASGTDSTEPAGHPDPEKEPEDPEPEPQPDPQVRIAWYMAQLETLRDETLESVSPTRLRDAADSGMDALLEASEPRVRLLQLLRQLPDEPDGVAESVRDQAQRRADAIPRIALGRRLERRFWEGSADYIDLILPSHRRR